MGDPAAELHVVLALMSTGPVGISDGLGFTNAELAKRMITADGTLLKPSKPVTSVDSSLAGSSSKPPGYVYSTYSGEKLDTVTAYYFVSFKMQKAWSMGARDFYPPLKSDTTYVHRTFDAGGCASGKPADSCVTIAKTL